MKAEFPVFHTNSRGKEHAGVLFHQKLTFGLAGLVVCDKVLLIKQDKWLNRPIKCTSLKCAQRVRMHH